MSGKAKIENNKLTCIHCNGSLLFHKPLNLFSFFPDYKSNLETKDYIALLDHYFAENNRYDHIIGVAKEMKQLTDEAIAWELAYLHDIGYALPYTGFHPLDGALYAEYCDMGRFVIQGILHHTLASKVAGDYSYIYDRIPAPFPDEQNYIDFITYADIHTTVQGEPCSLESRLKDIRDRFNVVQSNQDNYYGYYDNLRNSIVTNFKDIPCLVVCVDGLNESSLKAIEGYANKGRVVLVSYEKSPQELQSLSCSMRINSFPHVTGDSIVLMNGYLGCFGSTNEALMHVLGSMYRNSIGISYRDNLSFLDVVGLPFVISGGKNDEWHYKELPIDSLQSFLCLISS